MLLHAAAVLPVRPMTDSTAPDQNPLTMTRGQGGPVPGTPITSVAVVGTNLSGVVTLWSGGAAAMFGWTEEEALGRPIADLANWGLSRKDVTEFLFVGTSGLWVHEHEVTTRTAASGCGSRPPPRWSPAPRAWTRSWPPPPGSSCPRAGCGCR